MRTHLLKLVAVISGILLYGCKPNGDSKPESDRYFGLKPNDSIPVVFAPGIISFGNHEHHLTFMPDYSELFYAVADKYRKQHIIISRKIDNKEWSKPEVTTFSGYYSDFAPTPSPDGKYLLFCSNRPMPEDTAEYGDFNIWKVKNTDNGWSVPEPLPKLEIFTFRITMKLV